MRSLPFVCGFVCLVLGSLPAAAQSVDGRPNRAIFGGGVGLTEQRLVVSGQLGGGVDDLGAFVPADLPEGTPAPPRRSAFGHWSGNLAYAIDRDRFGFSSSISTAGRYFPEFDNSTVNTYGAQVGGNVRITARTAASANFNVSYQPLSLLSLLPGMNRGDGSELLPIDYGLGGEGGNYVSQNVNVGISHQLTMRTSLSASYSTGRSRFSQAGDDGRRGASISLGHEIGKGLGVRLGYGLDEGRYETAGAERALVRQHEIDAGIDFSRSLSLSRRTTLSFRTGSTIVSQDDNRDYRIVGNASLNHLIGRTWYTGLIFNRNVGFVDSLRQPSFADSITASLGGLLGRRYRVATHFGASRGEIGFGNDSNNYWAYRAGASVSLALSANFALRADYSYYRYQFDSALALPAEEVGRRVQRQSIRVGLDILAPLYNRVRRP